LNILVILAGWRWAPHRLSILCLAVGLLVWQLASFVALGVGMLILFI
jgi:hypothetical protein